MRLCRLKLGGTYSEAGATSDGGETVTISGAVDVNTAGIYTVTYSASDAAGNAAVEVVRTVNVVEVVAGENFGKVNIYTNLAATLYGQVTINGEAAGVGDIVAIYVGGRVEGEAGGYRKWWGSLVECAGSLLQEERRQRRSRCMM